MRATYGGSALASYRDSVTGLIKVGEPWHVVEAAVDEISGLSTESRDALWLMAFIKHGAHQRRQGSPWPLRPARPHHG
jgi:hypothetical protein